MQTIEQLTAVEEQQTREVAELREKLSIAQANLDATQNERAVLYADAVGVHVGCIVEWDEESWRRGKTTHRGKVKDVRPYYYGKDFCVQVVHIKKDGKEGFARRT